MSLNGLHAQRLKAIRPFVSFDYDLRKPLTPAQKRQITIYHREIEALTQRATQVYRPRNAERLRAAQQFGQHEKNLSRLTVAFIPTPVKGDIQFNKRGELRFKSEHVITDYIPLGRVELALDPIREVNAAIAKSDAKQFTVTAGKYEIPRSRSRDALAPYVAALASKYRDDQKNNYFGNWLNGVKAHSFRNQSDFAELTQAKAKARKRKAKRARKKTLNRKR